MLKNDDTKYLYYKNEWQWVIEPLEFEDVQTGIEAFQSTVMAAFEVFPFWKEASDYDWRKMSIQEIREAVAFEKEVDELEMKARMAVDNGTYALARCISRETGMSFLECLYDVNDWYNEMYDLRFGKVA